MGVFLIMVLQFFSFKNRVGILGGLLVRMFPWGASAQIWECPSRKHECTSLAVIASMQVECNVAPLRGFFLHVEPIFEEAQFLECFVCVPRKVILTTHFEHMVQSL